MALLTFPAAAADAQVRTVPSRLAVASQVPSGAIATPLTGPVWLVRVRIRAAGGSTGLSRWAFCAIEGSANDHFSPLTR